MRRAGMGLACEQVSWLLNVAGSVRGLAADSRPAPRSGTAGYPGCVRIFDGQTFDRWEADRSTWSIVDAAMRGVGGTSRLAYTKADYGSFRLIFTARMNPVNGDHLGVLFWGDRPSDPSKPKIDNAGWIQFMPPFAGMWDYHPPNTITCRSDRRPWLERFHPWCTTELLCNLEKGTMRAAVNGVELVRYIHPTPARTATRNSASFPVRSECSDTAVARQSSQGYLPGERSKRGPPAHGSLSVTADRAG